MKKYYFEADRKQWEKPTEPKYMFCATAKVAVCAETQAKAKKLAAEKLREKYHGTGILIGEPRLTKTAELPEDWNYGYGDERRSGTARDRKTLARDSAIR